MQLTLGEHSAALWIKEVLSKQCCFAAPQYDGIIMLG